MSSRRESRSAATELNTLQEFENRKVSHVWLSLDLLNKRHPSRSSKDLQGIERSTSQVRVLSLAIALNALTEVVFRKNNELLAQISLLNKQLQDSASENFQLRGEISNLQRNAGLHQAKALAFERERQTMLDLIDEVNRAVSNHPRIAIVQRADYFPQTEWSKKNLASLRRSFELVDNSSKLHLAHCSKTKPRSTFC